MRVVDGTIADFFKAGVSLHASPDGLVRDVRVLRIGAGGVEGQTSAGILVVSGVAKVRSPRPAAAALYAAGLPSASG